MSMVVVAAIHPPTGLSGYLSRYLQEPISAVWIGSLSAALQSDMAAAMERYDARGFVVAAGGQSDAGIVYLYFNVEHRELLDMDGAYIVEKLVSIRKP